MGCHTWCYSRLEQEKCPTEENLKESVERFYVENIKLYREIIETSLIPEWAEGTISSIKQCWHMRSNLESRYKKWVNKGRPITSNWAIETYISQIQLDSGFKIHLEYHNGIWFKECGSHDIFRIWGYPETVLLSEEDTIKFCEQFKSENPEMVLTDKEYEKIKSFWNNHPNGLIRFG